MEDKLGRSDFEVERYKYILQQLGASNENVHRFLAVYQSLATLIVGGGITLFVSYRKWEIPADVAKSGLLALGWLLCLVALFTILMIGANMASWYDYRKEECSLVNSVVDVNFRKAPRLANFYRWHETYIIVFIVVSNALLWLLLQQYVLPNIV
ncbi:hypothetical protein [Actinoplanes sp. NPDC026670]|uniref:hypothetical protein n=1 Tax=Actinoplanes sp. NPDC026670 TaxID=3154700 RepID=UPI0033DF86F7